MVGAETWSAGIYAWVFSSLRGLRVAGLGLFWARSAAPDMLKCSKAGIVSASLTTVLDLAVGSSSSFSCENAVGRLPSLLRPSFVFKDPNIFGIVEVDLGSRYRTLLMRRTEHHGCCKQARDQAGMEFCWGLENGDKHYIDLGDVRFVVRGRLKVLRACCLQAGPMP